MQTESGGNGERKGISVEVAHTGLLARMAQQDAGSWRWAGALHNPSGFERSFTYTHNPDPEQAKISVVGIQVKDSAPDPAFVNRLKLRLWQAVQNVEPDEPRYYRAQPSEVLRPAVQAMGREHAHWRPYAIVPEPSAARLDEMVANLSEFGIDSRATISAGSGAVLAVDPLKHGRTPADVDFLVTVAVMGTERE